MSGTETRRDVLRRSGAAAAALGLGLGLSAAARASDPDAYPHTADIPEHVSLEHDEEWLERYQPRLAMSSDAASLFSASYAWRASSTEYDTDVGVYWQRYVTQEGYSRYDSHWGDREPVYVFVDEDGEVERVMASIYHWLKGEVPASETVLYDETHPDLRVVDPHHQHTVATDAPGRVRGIKSLGSRADIEDPDATTQFEAWLANGWDHSLGVGTVTEPWTMRSRESWWRRGAFGVSLDEFRWDVFRRLGIGTVGELGEE